MIEYCIKILGAQYAANPDYKFGDPETPEMWARTIDMLSTLRDMRPRVVLKPEPTNPNDHLAEMAGTSPLPPSLLISSVSNTFLIKKICKSVTFYRNCLVRT
jgi:hypothetical protein